MVLLFFGCAVCLVSGIAKKAAMVFPKSFFSGRTSSQVIFKQMFSVNSVLQIVMVMVFLSLGFIHNAVKQGWANCGPRAACGPRRTFVRPAKASSKKLKKLINVEERDWVHFSH